MVVVVLKRTTPGISADLCRMYGWQTIRYRSSLAAFLMLRFNPLSMRHTGMAQGVGGVASVIRGVEERVVGENAEADSSAWPIR